LKGWKGWGYEVGFGLGELGGKIGARGNQKKEYYQEGSGGNYWNGGGVAGDETRERGKIDQKASGYDPGKRARFKRDSILKERGKRA